MPYKDPQKYRDNKRTYMREYRARQRQHQAQMRSDYQGVKEQFEKQPELIAEKLTSPVTFDEFRQQVMSEPLIPDVLIDEATKLAYKTYLMLSNTLAEANKIPFAERVNKWFLLLLAVMDQSVLPTVTQFLATYESIKDLEKQVLKHPGISAKNQKDARHACKILDVVNEKIRLDVKHVAEIEKAKEHKNRFVI